MSHCIIKWCKIFCPYSFNNILLHLLDSFALSLNSLIDYWCGLTNYDFFLLETWFFRKLYLIDIKNFIKIFSIIFSCYSSFVSILILRIIFFKFIIFIIAINGVTFHSIIVIRNQSLRCIVEIWIHCTSHRILCII